MSGEASDSQPSNQPADSGSVTPGSGRFLRPVLVGLSVVLAVFSMSTLADWRANQAELRAILSDSQNPEDAIRGVGFERTPHHAKLIAARSLVYGAMHPGDEVVSAEEVSARLGQARRLALEVLKEQPNSWPAAMFLGAATYLDRSLRSDRRLYTEAADWEKPLLKALGEAEGKLEPRRFLLGAYLETWPALSAEKKAFVTELIEAAFREDPIAFTLLSPVWLDVAGEQALDVMPDRPEVWQVLERKHAAAGDWSAFQTAREHYLKALESQLTADLNDAEKRLRLGDAGNARTICLNTIVAAPRDGRFAPIATRALETYPPGIHGFRSTETLSEWLDWALELETIAVRPFTAKALGRLTDAIGEIEPATGALAALLAEDEYRTKRYERLAKSKRDKTWAPFLIAKAQRLVARGDALAAQRTLDEVHREYRDSIPYWLVRERIARGEADLSAIATAEQRLATLRQSQWRADQWRWRGPRVTLMLYPEVSGKTTATLEIEINKAPPGGAVVGIYWDGTLVGMWAVVEEAVISAVVEAEPRPHLLETRALAGGEVFPGRVSLDRSRRRPQG
ncbi:MAG: hypothetical protein AAF657_00930 [Acidobacteriota bacterium]